MATTRVLVNHSKILLFNNITYNIYLYITYIRESEKAMVFINNHDNQKAGHDNIIYFNRPTDLRVTFRLFVLIFNKN